MKLETFSFTERRGWSEESLPDMDSESTLVMVYGSPSFLDKPGVVEELFSHYPNSHIIGCSTSGEIFDTMINDDSLSVAVSQFEKTRLAAANAQVTKAEDSYDAGKALANSLQAPDLKAVFVLSNGIHVNGSELVRGLNEALPGDVVVTGGLAGDGDRFERTWVVNDNELSTEHVSAVGLYGDHVHVGHGSKGGWDVFGPERRVTKAEGNVLYELDGKPALDLYKEYLGELAAELPASALLFPLALRETDGDEKSVVRTILAVDEDERSMTFAGDIPTGSFAQLMKANFERLINGAGEAASMVNGHANGHSNGNGAHPTLSVAISCVGRRLVLGERTEEELEATLEVLPEGVQQVGFYSYGEISPYASGSCDLHNQTMTLTTIQEF